MTKNGKTIRLVLCSAFLVLFSLVTLRSLQAQEIRPLAEPNQSIRMGRGGYICEGHLTHTAIDATENWTYEMVECSGQIFGSGDYAALHAKLNHDELVKLNEALDQLNTTSSATQEALNRQALVLNSDFRATIEKRFQDLPHDVLLTAAIQNLKKSLLDYVEQKLPTTSPTKSPASRSTAPGKSQQSPIPPQP